MTLAQLVDVAEIDDLRRHKYALDSLALRYLGLELTKSDPYRLRFGELVEHDWSQPVDLGFLHYAIPDAIVTWQLWQSLRARCRHLQQEHSIPETTIRRFGYLGESLISRSNLAFRAMSLRGVELDRTAADTCRTQLTERAQQLVRELEIVAPDYFSKFQEPRRVGAYRYLRDGAVIPSGKRKVLVRRLTELATRLNLQPPRTQTSGELTTSLKYWRQFSDQDAFVTLWVQLGECQKLLQFIEHLQVERVHPRYGLTRSGRATATGPNIQQMPAREEFRRLFVPGEGKLVLGLDYSSIEMLTLAAECHERYGESQLRDVLKSDTDPHSFTASMLLGMTYDQFQALAETDPSQFKLHRAKAKIANFGFPAGYSARSLAISAKLDRGIEMTVAEAEQMRDRFLYHVYPELGRYMTEDVAETIAANLGVPREALLETFPEPWQLPLLRRLCEGETANRDGKKYSRELVETVWSALAELDHDGRYAAAIADGNDQHLRQLFWQPTVNRPA